jgi:F0F1-type ATP synthase assembly protein I
VRGRRRKIKTRCEQEQPAASGAAGGVLAKSFTSITFSRLSAFRREMRMVQQRRTEPVQAAAATKYLGVGLTVALATGLFTFAGMRVDRWLDTEPWLTLIGAFVGASAGFYYMYYHLVMEPRHRQAKREGKDG